LSKNKGFESISDNYEKIILTIDKTINKDYNGNKIKNYVIIDTKVT